MMKSNIVFLFALILFSCCSKKTTSANNISQKVNICADNGTCTIEILKNKSISINADFGKTNYILIDDFDKNVVKYQYAKNLEESNIDGGYREEIIFEIDNKKNEISLQDIDLQQTKMLFGRYCNCRGQTGLYKVVRGSIDLKNHDDVSFDLNFKITEVPQVTNNVVVTNGKL